MAFNIYKLIQMQIYLLFSQKRQIKLKQYSCNFSLSNLNIQVLIQHNMQHLRIQIIILNLTFQV